MDSMKSEATYQDKNSKGDKMRLNKEAIGSSFDDFLAEEKHIRKTEMAKRMGTSRSALTRLLDPMNSSITLATIETALAAIGKRVQIRIV
jgi:antitoxin HicB